MEKDLVTLAVALLTITNPIGTMAIFAGLVEDLPEARKRATALTAGVAILVIFLIVTWGGEEILDLFGISIPAFQAAGGVIILLMGLSMLHGKPSPIHHSGGAPADVGDSVAIVPVAIPLVAGPGAITTIVIAAHGEPGVTARLLISGVCAAIALVLWLALHFASPLSRRLGPQAVGITSRVMGILLTAIAVEMIAEGGKELWPGLAG